MPLAGTPQETKYAAQVARSIVHGNTAAGRKLKSTTEFGREWGPPYGKPLSNVGAEHEHQKESAFYAQGQCAALEKLGFGGFLSGAIGKAIPSFGRLVGRSALLGGGIGALTGGVAGARRAPEGEGGQGFLRGALSGGLTGAALGGLSGGLGGRLIPGTTRQIPTLSPLGTGVLGGLGGSVAGGVAAPNNQESYWQYLKHQAGPTGLGF
jgi:hypothetical protein